MNRGRAAVAALAAVAAGACVQPPQIDVPGAATPPRRSRILAADGTPLATLFTENRDPVRLFEVSAEMRRAVVAAEDQRFYRHPGFDGKAIARAAAANAASGRTVQGGSTITQQYVKNLYFPKGRPHTIQQKIREAELAWRIEQVKGKDEILEGYLNTIYFGDGAYGIRAASEEFFRKHPRNLTLPQAALLAGLIKSPGRFNPRLFPAESAARRNHVLRRMRVLSMISRSREIEAASAPVEVSPRLSRRVREPHFVEYVKRFVYSNPAFGADEAERADFLFNGGVDIRSTLDLRLQRAARNAIAGVLNAPGDPEAALVAIDPKTGEVVAMVGGRDFSRSQVNLALGREGGGSGRQPGSSFKPFVLAAALEDGISADAIYEASRPVFKVSETEVWSPVNFGGAVYGPMSLRRAMSLSVNTVYARLGMEVGPGRVAGMASRLGISADLSSHPSIALGAEEVSPLDMASAYATLAAYGTYHSPTPVDFVRFRSGDVLRPQVEARPVLSPGVAWLVTGVLRGVIDGGTAQRGSIGRPAAAKTGTSQDFADAWYVGYTPELVAAVWIGYPDARIPMTSVRGGVVDGSTLGAAIWRTFMLDALRDTPPTGFDPPASEMIRLEIDPSSGFLAAPWCPGRVVRVLRQLAPAVTCPSPPPPAVTATATSPVTGTATPKPKGPSPSPSPAPPTSTSTP